MSEYRKGRVLVLLGMLGFSTISVLVGTAGADAGTIKVKGVVDGQVSTTTGNEPHVSSGCVNIAADGFTPIGGPVFTPMAPTSDLKLSPPAQVNGWWSLVPAPDNTASPSPQGWHIRVSVDGKTKVFWVKAGAPGCDPVNPDATPNDIWF